MGNNADARIINGGLKRTCLFSTIMLKIFVMIAQNLLNVQLLAQSILSSNRGKRKEIKTLAIIGLLIIVGILPRNTTEAFAKDNTIILCPKDTFQISGNEDGKYNSSNKKIVAVDKNGLITAKRKGTARITIRSNGKKSTIKIKVKKIPYRNYSGKMVNQIGKKITVDFSVLYDGNVDAYLYDSIYFRPTQSGNGKIVIESASDDVAANKGVTTMISVMRSDGYKYLLKAQECRMENGKKLTTPSFNVKAGELYRLEPVAFSHEALVTIEFKVS